MPEPDTDPAGPRYAPANRLYRLILLLAAARYGLSLDEIAAELGVGRRTAERLRSAVAGLFPQLLCAVGDDRVHRWRLPGTVPLAIPPAPDSIATLEIIARDLKAHGDLARASHVQTAITTMRALMPDTALTRAEPDIEALMTAEGSAARPGPPPAHNPAVLATHSHAHHGCHTLALDYASANHPTPTPRRLQPYGVLYGHRAYLIAQIENTAELRVWRLDRMQNVTATRTSFTRAAFDLASFANRALGVFQEDPFNIVLRFTAAAAPDAATWHFHPNQQQEFLPDGRLIVRFRAGGTWELSWHLFTWADTVEILQPTRLRQHLCQLATTAASHHATAPMSPAS
ncbi:MAG: WYL domain-containing protein [Acidocella sp.]|nr:WYL domain-containing protein [Acidocella sp.]